MKRPDTVKSPDGKLAVMLPGMGAVATTTIAGVMLARRGLGAPIGSLTQLGTIRLGKRTDNRVPKIKDFVPLASLERPRVRRLGHLPRRRLRGGHARGRARAQAPRGRPRRARGRAADARRLLPRLRAPPPRHPHQGGHQQGRDGGEGARRHPHLQEGARLLPRRRGVVRLDRDLHPRRRRAPVDQVLRGRPPRQRAGDLQRPDLRVGVHQGGRPLRQRRPQPLRRLPRRVGPGAGALRRHRRQRLQDRPDADEDRHRADAQGPRARPARLVLHQHPRQPRRRGARRPRLVPHQGGLQAGRARAHPPVRRSTPSSTGTSSTRSASSTTRPAATPRRAGTTSICSAGSATRCR